MDAGWKVWGIRAAISLAATALVAWGISFMVADYVVKAHTASTNQALDSNSATLAAIQASSEASVGAIQTSLDQSFQGLQSSIDSLNTSVLALTDRIDGVNVTVTSVSTRTAETATEVVSLRRDVEVIRSQVLRLSGTTPAVFYGGGGIPTEFDPAQLSEEARAMLARDGWAITDGEPIIFDLTPPGRIGN